MGMNHEKNGGRKFRDTLPLSSKTTITADYFFTVTVTNILVLKCWKSTKEMKKPKFILLKAEISMNLFRQYALFNSK